MGAWITAQWKTITEAVGVRAFTIGISAAAVLATLKFFEDKGFIWLREVPDWTVGPFVFLAYMLSWILVYATKKRQELEPRLAIEFRPNDAHLVHIQRPDAPDAHLYSGDYMCYRIRVRNVGGQRLEKCTVQLASVVTDAGQQHVGYAFNLRHDRSGAEMFALSPGEEAWVSVLSVPLGPTMGRIAKAAAFGESWPHFEVIGTGVPLEPATITVQALSEAPFVQKLLRFEAGPNGIFEVRNTPQPPPRPLGVRMMEFWTPS